MSLRSVPPPPPSEPRAADAAGASPRRPGLARSGLLPARLAGRDIVQGWRARRHVSDRDVRAVLRAPQSRIDTMSSGDAAFPLDLFFALVDAGCERDALELLRDVDDAIRQYAARRRTA